MQPSVTLSALCLVAAVLCYGASSLLLSQGSHAVRGRAYLFGLAFQGLAFLLAFVARVDLPLLVVQSAVAASVAVTAVAGAALGRWRLTGPDGVALVAVIAGIALVGSASRPGRVELGQAGPLLVAAAVAALALAGVAGVAARLGATPLGALAGLAYGSSAVAARALAGDPLAAVRSPVGLLAGAVLAGGLLAGQVLLTVAFRRGGTGGPGSEASTAVTGPVAAMYVAATLWPAAAGLAWLGDALHAGRELPAAAGVVLALAGTTLLTRHDQ